jgi:DNA-directed RNA polymerase alpha subunit
LSLGFPNGPVERVGFRVESVDTFSQENEVLIFEVLTNGSLSPNQALNQAALTLVRKFSAIAHVTLSFYPVNSFIDMKFRKNFLSHKHTEQNLEVSEQTSFRRLFDTGFPTILNLDLGNLNLSKERYSDFQGFGFQSLGQLLERLESNVYIFPYSLKKRRQESLIYFGISPYSIFLW